MRSSRACAELPATLAGVRPGHGPRPAGGGDRRRPPTPSILRVGTIQRPRLAEPVRDRSYFVGYEIFTLNYDLLVDFGPNIEPVPGFAESWTQRDGTHLDVQDPARHEVVGRPAGDVRGRALVDPVRPRRAEGQDDDVVGLGYLDPYLTDAGVTAVTAPDPTTLVVTTTQPEQPDPRPRTSRSCPSTSGRSATSATSATSRTTPPVVGTGPYQVVEWKTGQYVAPRPQPQLLGHAGLPRTRSSSSSSRTQRTRWSRRSRPASSTTPGTSPPTSSTAQGRPTSDRRPRLAAEANGFTQLNFNTYNKPIQDGGASTKALQDPAFRDALGYAIDKPTLVDKVLVGLRRRRHDARSRRWQAAWHPSRTTSADLRHRHGQARSSTRPATRSTPTASALDKEGKPINLRLVVPNTDPSYAKDAAVHPGLVRPELGIKVTTQVLDDGTLVTD